MFWRRLFCTLVILSVSLWHRPPVHAQAAVRTIPVAMKGPYMVVSPDGHTAALFENGPLFHSVPDILHVPIRLIDLNSGDTVQQLSGFTDYASAAAFTPDSKRIVTVHSNGMIYVWDVASGKQVKAIQGLLGLNRAKLLSDGKTLVVVTSGMPNQMLFWDIETGNMTRIMGRRFTSYSAFQEQMKQPMAITDLTFAAFAVSPDGKMLATATAADEVVVWDVVTNKSTLARPASEKKGLFSIRSLVFTADSKALVYYDAQSKSTHFWDIDSSTESKALPVGSAVFALSPNGDRLAWVDTQHGPKVRIVNIAGEPQDLADIPSTTLTAPPITTLAFTPDGRQLVVGGFMAADENNAIYVIDVGK